MRKAFAIIIIFLSCLLFASYMSFDTNEGVALHFPVSDYEVFVGYRYSGFQFEKMFNDIGFSFKACIDPFSLSGYSFAGIYVEPLSSHLESGAMVSVLSSDGSDGKFIKRGNIDMYLSCAYKVDFVDFGLSLQKTVFGFYSDSDKDIIFVIPPLETESLGVVVEPFVKFTFGDSPKVNVKISYMLNLFRTESLPSALINLYGFRIIFAAGDF
ncbi:hypothetical protein [Pseudothermotoga lettingae]|uniref:hypothetical protein n=1 Tax=Pseudothermotoga lettingae TaxID=177758 RepID=UPI000747B8F9|nr:hypothetical protein [Pseudothermotoga lettingae]KUK21913.1 MAG: Uncharacterized protein XD56_0159 [Pseudothermotoga lettingae]